jgi:hypothetical protein
MTGSYAKWCGRTRPRRARAAPGSARHAHRDHHEIFTGAWKLFSWRNFWRALVRQKFRDHVCEQGPCPLCGDMTVSRRAPSWRRIMENRT